MTAGGRSGGFHLHVELLGERAVAADALLADGDDGGVAGDKLGRGLQGDHEEWATICNAEWKAAIRSGRREFATRNGRRQSGMASRINPVSHCGISRCDLKGEKP